MFKKHGKKKFLIHARGGDLKTEINENNAGEEEIFLIGGAEYVFEGKIKFNE